MRQLQEYFSQSLISLFAVGEAARTAGEQSSGGTRGLDYSAAWERSAAELLVASPCTLSAPCLCSPIPEPIVVDAETPAASLLIPVPTWFCPLGASGATLGERPKAKCRFLVRKDPSQVSVGQTLHWDTARTRLLVGGWGAFMGF